MPAIPPFGSFSSSRKVLNEVTKLRLAIERGSLDRRDNLVEKLGELAMAYATEGRFDDTLNAWDETLELTETLLAEGKLEIAQTMIFGVFPIPDMVRVYQMQHQGEAPGYNEDAFFQRMKKSIGLLSEKDFLIVKNEWALSIHQRAESLQEKEAHIAAIALLDESLHMLEPHFDLNSTRFTDWKPFLDIYRSRGQWKCEIGDTEAGIADLLHFEELAKKVSILQKRNTSKIGKKNSNPQMQDGKIVIRISADDYTDFAASYFFQEDRFEAILHLANAYTGRAEKDKALKYFDKALAIYNKDVEPRDNPRLLYFAAPMNIPYRKGVIYAQYHEFEEALELYDLAIKNVKQLLQSEHKEYFEQLESQFAEISHARADALRNLGRFDEAKDALETTLQLFTPALNPEKPRKDSPLSMKNLLASASHREKNPLGKIFDDGKFDEKQALYQFGVLHNEATMDISRSQIEMLQGNWRKALRLLLKARFVLDSPVMTSFPEAQKNVFGCYQGIASMYANLKEDEKALLWFERTVKHGRKLIDDGDSDFRNTLYPAQKTRGDFLARLNQYDQAMVEYEHVFAMQNQLIQEQEAALEGLDREHLRVHDNQKLMPLAVLYQAQIETIRSIENLTFATNSPEAAESWVCVEVETFEKFHALLLEPEQAIGDYAKVATSCAAILRWVGKEEKAKEILDRWIADAMGRFETDDEARVFINDGVSVRVKELYAMTDFCEEAYLFARVAQLTNNGRYEEAYHAAGVFHAIMVHLQEQLQDAQSFKHELYAGCIRLIYREVGTIIHYHPMDEVESEFQNHPYDPSEMRAILDQMEEEEDAKNADDEPDEDENAALYERDFENASDNHAMLFKMMDAFSGKNRADELIDEYDRHKGTFRNESDKVGRNDPCPCGSGKKYKKCCMDR